MLWWSNRAFIAHLKAENAWLRDQMLLERKRSEDAINALLSQKTGGVMLTTTAPPAPAEDAIQRLMRDTEFATVGGME